MNLFEFWQSHASELTGLFAQHLLLVLVSTAIAVAIGIPVGVAAARRPRAGAPIVWLANVAQTSRPRPRTTFVILSEAKDLTAQSNSRELLPSRSG